VVTRPCVFVSVSGNSAETGAAELEFLRCGTVLCSYSISL